ncbi:MAG: DUF5050 domain-containing protein [Candidatus Pelethousia sp.]|nr:DUF5050 domain-containing protein [Candidatus Pelethousia sp.]
MRIRIIITLLLCLALAAGCSAPLAFPPEGTAEPANAPLDGTPPPESPTPTSMPPAENASRSFSYAALNGDTVYWCTSSGVLAMNATGDGKLLSGVKACKPLVMGDYLYVVEEETDVTDEVAWPVPSDSVTASNILRIPLAGGEAEQIYTTTYINTIAATDGRLYFSTTQGEALQDVGGLFSIDAKGGDERLLAEDCTRLCAVQDDYVYYMGVVEEASAFFRVQIEGGEAEQLLAGPAMPVTPLAYQGDIYYVNTDFSSAEAKNNLTIMRLRNGKSEVLGAGFNAHELLGIWDSKLYYAAPMSSEQALLSLVRIDLSTLDSETLRKEAANQFAALSGAYAAYSDYAPLYAATELKLMPLPGEEPVTLKIEDVVESQG